MKFAERCAEIERQFEKIEQSLADPKVLADTARYREVAKTHRSLEQVVRKWREVRKVAQSLDEARSLLDDADPEMAEMARAEVEQYEKRLPEIERELALLLLPPDPMDEKNIVMEIRAGTGGEEAALFAADLFRMYCRYAESKGWKTEILSQNPTEIGGFKEIVFGVSGDGVYSRLKFESGTHRVQRVPATEASGRIHTSAITVAVMPEADEVDVAIKPEDVRIDVFRSSGPGGQSVNTTDSAVRVTHLDSGLVVSCQDEKSQLKNKVKALKVLRSRLYELEIRRRQEAESASRRQQVGTGDRSGRIRTYNFPQNRLTDHRIGLTLYRLEQVVEGEMNELIEALRTDEETRKLERVASGTI
ncbi:peptide chain release factor 1 [Candidatus Sumerlaeota bacterium]|nr:peptide chain release factor 1 [Candidatus Sumerlaeota bacterium]